MIASSQRCASRGVTFGQVADVCERGEHLGETTVRFGQFAEALLEEMQHEENPLVLVQDYHFALLPRLIKDARPDARVAIFWHIPWPNPEAFGICPWQAELLDGLLGRI